MDGDDILNDPGFEDFAKRAVDELLPMIQNSVVTVQLVPKGPPDVKIALELGFMIMLDKPIILLAQPGQKIPAKLVMCADAIIEGDLSTEEGARDAVKRIQAKTEELVGETDV